VGRLIRIVVVGGAIVLVLVGALVWFVLSNLDAYVKRAVERVGSETTGTTVALDGARISIKSTEGALDGLTIDNPPGFETRHAFELDEVQLDLDLATIRSDEIVLRKVAVEGAHLTFEQRGDSNNLREILRHVERAGEDAESDGGDTEETRMVIETFTFRGGRLTVIDDRLDEDLTFEIPDVTVRDVGRVGAGETLSNVAAQLIDPVLRRALDAAQDQAKAKLEERVNQEIEDQKEKAVESLKKRLLGND
jgi:uncharacterized protein involved in outer membrane biogenesis